ncbi:hypothetical protein [Micromonospora sp. NPDC005367]|uniref:hypothetical protein n=1 Tax=Micromonospora sp. NPDC005367 TaxID=3155590 RepID=UPI00339F3010
MTLPNGRLWVNPEGVSSVGDSYSEHVALYQSYLAQVSELRDRYSSSWGDDEMGQQFSKQFLGELGSLEDILEGVKAKLEYTAGGLREAGLLYRQADDDAADSSHKMARTFETNLRSAGVVRAAATAGGAGAPAGELTPLTPRVGRPLEPTVEPLSPMIEARPLTSMTPAMSSYVADPSYATASVNGQPIPAGHHLQAFAPLPDGSVHLDVNVYDSVTPVGDTPVTDAGGQVLDPGDRRFFVVKNNPDVDPTVPGYQPRYVSVAADGAIASLPRPS